MSLPEENGRWHLDKRVPITLIIAILVQTGAFIWMISSMHEQIQQNERRIELLEARFTETKAIVAQNATSVAVSAETLRNIEASLARIEKKIDGD